MTCMPENMPETIAHAPLDLLPHLERIVDPSFWFHGRCREASLAMPESILIFKARQASHIQKDFHHRHVLIVPVTGSGRVIVDNRTYALQPGRCALIRPYQFHHFTRFSREKLDWLFVTFEREEPVPLDVGMIFSPPVLFWADLEALLQAFARPRSMVTDNQLSWRLALLLSCLEELSPERAEIKTHIKPDEAFLLRVHALVAKNIREPLSIKGLAHPLGVSESRLRARFKAAAGQSLGRYQRKLRLQLAAGLFVANRHLSVAEVAERVGWESPFAFSRAFRRHWGRSPKWFVQGKPMGLAGKKMRQF